MEAIKHDIDIMQIPLCIILDKTEYKLPVNFRKTQNMVQDLSLICMTQKNKTYEKKFKLHKLWTDCILRQLKLYKISDPYSSSWASIYRTWIENKLWMDTCQISHVQEQIKNLLQIFLVHKQRKGKRKV